MSTRDPEVEEILAATRSITRQIDTLSKSIDSTVDELLEFVTDLRGTDQMINKNTYQGPERRREPR